MTKLIINVETGETLERELNEAELNQEIIDTTKAASKIEAEQIEAEAKATAKAALLERLGITAEEAQLLLGGN